jgi:hypothetical protein
MNFGKLEAAARALIFSVQNIYMKQLQELIKYLYTNYIAATSKMITLLGLLHADSSY